MFFAQLLGDIIYLGAGHHYLQFKTPLIRFLVTPGNWGFNIAEVAMSYGKTGGNWIRMKPDQQSKGLSIFTAKTDTVIPGVDWFTFRVKIVSTIENYSFVDTTWVSDLFSEKQFADVDVLVGQNKLRAHRFLLSARSPVLKTLLSNTADSLTIDENFDLSTVEHFLKFLYTGTLSISANSKQLLALAEKYQVETLKEICQLSVRGHESSTAEDITTSLLALI